jgi:hypothetical protein
MRDPITDGLKGEWVWPRTGKPAFVPQPLQRGRRK